MSDSVRIEIDGKPIDAVAGKMIIQVADENGFTIPRFCYHHKLSVSANCRMCLVEVEKAPKTLPACATPVANGMKVFTQSKKALESQRAVMEFLLINHPLDCPICDQGGQCELQDFSMEYGQDYSNYSEPKRAVNDDDLGPLIATEMTRCIHCTRCVRFGEEVAGVREIGMMGRGEESTIGTYIKQTVSHEMSANIIDLCPVGALTSKPFAFSARAWELNQLASIAPHDCVGSNISVHTRRNQVMRVVPRDNESLNESWLSDRDRFSYSALRSEQRLTEPMIKQNGTWQTVPWHVAFNYVADALGKIKDVHGAGAIGSFISPSATCEEMTLLQRVMSGLGSNNIDYRLRQTDFSAETVFPTLTVSVSDIEKQQAILLIGSHIRQEQPIIAHRIRKAQLQGADIMLVNSIDYKMNFSVAEKKIIKPSLITATLTCVLRALQDAGQVIDANDSVKAMMLKSKVEPCIQNIAAKLMGGEAVLVLLGHQAIQHQDASQIQYLANVIAETSNAILGILTEGANAAGAHITQCVPSQGSLNANLMLKRLLKAYWLHGVEPDQDFMDAKLCDRALRDADLVVAVTSFATDSLLSKASVLLPMATFAETSGTYINCEGRWQSFTGCVTPPGEARPAWKIYRVLANVLNLPGFDYQSSEEVLKTLKNKQRVVDVIIPAVTVQYKQNQTIERATQVPMYAVDMLCRHAQPLREMQSYRGDDVVRLHSVLAQKHNVNSQITLKQAGIEHQFNCVIDDAVPIDVILIPATTNGSSMLGPLFGNIDIIGGK